MSLVCGGRAAATSVTSLKEVTQTGWSRSWRSKSSLKEGVREHLSKSSASLTDTWQQQQASSTDYSDL